nr:unnamed protein product [Callosobruchus chinensis]
MNLRNEGRKVKAEEPTIKLAPIPWPARSPDLTPPDFLSGEVPKNATEVPTLEILIQRSDLGFEIMKEEMHLNTTTVEIRNRRAEEYWRHLRATISSKHLAFSQMRVVIVYFDVVIHTVKT